MSTHKFLWDKDINGHTCAHCGATMARATREQYLSQSRAIDRAHEIAGDNAGVSQSATLNGSPLWAVRVNTEQGLAESRYLIDDTGDIVAQGYFVNSRPVDNVPATFRKFHKALTVELRDALSMWAVNVWAVNRAEDNGNCTNNANTN